MLWGGVALDSSLAPLICTGIVARPAALVEVRHNLERWAAHAGLSTRDVGDLVLASYEALANAVEHAYPSGEGPVDLVAARTTDSRVLITVRDHGRWRPPPADPGSRGRGLPMIKALAHRAQIQQHPHGTFVYMEWQLSVIGCSARPVQND
jgi:anti-sigma regulatory factor (Ser/Thr protein kinase)